jgi:DNA segregation ATPase FtsK/SpoIIIE, S-DNA-T family
VVRPLDRLVGGRLVTQPLSVTEIRNALRCPRVFALGRARGQTVLFPIGASALGAVFHRLVAAFAREPDLSRLSRLPAGAAVDEVARTLSSSLLRLLAADLARSPTYASMPAEVDDLAEALRELARHLAGACAAGGVVPAEAIARFLAGAELPLDLSVDHGGGSVRLTGRMDAVHVPPGGAAEVVEYKLTEDNGEELDRAQVALYRFLLARARDLDASPVILRFRPGLTVTRLPPRDADALVEGRLIPLLADMVRWSADPRGVPATDRTDLCAACPVRADCIETYPQPLAPRDQPPAGATRPRPDPSGDLYEPPVAARPVVPAPAGGRAAGDRAALSDAEKTRGLILDIFKRQGVSHPTAPPPVVGARLIQIEVSVSRGSVAAVERAASDVERRLAADHGITAHFSKKGALRVFTVPRAEPRPVRLGDLLAGRADYLAARPGRFVVGEAADGAPLTGDLSDPSSCHLLIGGVSGSGKTVLLRALAASLVHFHSPAAINLTLIDPRRVSFAGLAAGLAAHLHRPLVHSTDEALPILAELVEEMELRYGLFDGARVQDIDEFNETQSAAERLARRVVIIDEFQDLVTQRPIRDAFLDTVQRLGAKARASGIHLILATQRPTRDAVPTSIKANLPGKIALKVTSAGESRIILDARGAEDLLGKGDLLADLGHAPVRAQAPAP